MTGLTVILTLIGCFVMTYRTYYLKKEKRRKQMKQSRFIIHDN